MSRALNGTAQYLEGAPPLTVAPLTIAAWFQVASVTNHTLVNLGVAGGGNGNRFQLSLSSLQKVQAITNTSNQADTTANYGTGAWVHGAAVFTSPSSRAALLAGGNKVTSATSATPVGINVNTIGARWNGTRGLFLAGLIAEVAIWDVALSDAEVAQLAAGDSPSLVQPGALKGYWPFLSDDLDASGNGYHLTPANGPTFDPSHPAINYGTAPRGWECFVPGAPRRLGARPFWGECLPPVARAVPPDAGAEVCVTGSDRSVTTFTVNLDC